MNQEPISRRVARVDAREGISRAQRERTSKQTETCGRTRSVTGSEYPPCARDIGHEEAYCRAADGKTHFLALYGPRRVETPACPDPIECEHEAALGQAETKLDSVHALAQAWSRPTMTAPTRLAGAHLLRLLAEAPSSDAETPRRMRPLFTTRPGDATVDPAMCPSCKGDNQEAFELCATCTAGSGGAVEEPDATETREVEDPARIDRLRPEFTEHASTEAIDAQLRRSRAQERRWHLRVEWLISLRQARVKQKELGEWPAVSQPGEEN